MFPVFCLMMWTLIAGSLSIPADTVEAEKEVVQPAVTVEETIGQEQAETSFETR